MKGMNPQITQIFAQLRNKSADSADYADFRITDAIRLELRR
jgi:hypothetical protein